MPSHHDHASLIWQIADLLLRGQGSSSTARHFYKYMPPRPLEEIDADLKRAEEEIMRLLREVTK